MSKGYTKKKKTFDLLLTFLFVLFFVLSVACTTNLPEAHSYCGFPSSRKVIRSLRSYPLTDVSIFINIIFDFSFLCLFSLHKNASWVNKCAGGILHSSQMPPNPSILESDLFQPLWFLYFIFDLATFQISFSLIASPKINTLPLL